MKIIEALILIISNITQFIRERQMKKAGHNEVIIESERKHDETVDIANRAGDAGEQLCVDTAPYERDEE